MSTQPNNPLHGIKLEEIIVKLEQQLGWQAMANAVDINCFKDNPSVKSSLKFLRRTPWARAKVEQLYLDTFHAFQWPEIKK
ncbi:VF530 family protein [Pseudoalteromonas piscicida]|uniref:VF530 family protein n=1 Tax=Pseudoalteromonas piscicida TaxID=43662 RepID=UPI0030991742